MSGWELPLPPPSLPLPRQSPGGGGGEWRGVVGIPPTPTRQWGRQAGSGGDMPWVPGGYNKLVKSTFPLPPIWSDRRHCGMW